VITDLFEIIRATDPARRRSSVTMPARPDRYKAQETIVYPAKGTLAMRQAPLSNVYLRLTTLYNDVEKMANPVIKKT
jgi:hypothetical protein